MSANQATEKDEKFDAYCSNVDKMMAERAAAENNRHLKRKAGVEALNDRAKMLEQDVKKVRAELDDEKKQRVHAEKCLEEVQRIANEMMESQSVIKKKLDAATMKLTQANREKDTIIADGEKREKINNEHIERLQGYIKKLLEDKAHGSEEFNDSIENVNAAELSVAAITPQQTPTVNVDPPQALIANGGQDSRIQIGLEQGSSSTRRDMQSGHRDDDKTSITPVIATMRAPQVVGRARDPLLPNPRGVQEMKFAYQAAPRRYIDRSQQRPDTPRPLLVPHHFSAPEENSNGDESTFADGEYDSSVDHDSSYRRKKMADWRGDSVQVVEADEPKWMIDDRDQHGAPASFRMGSAPALDGGLSNVWLSGTNYYALTVRKPRLLKYAKDDEGEHQLQKVFTMGGLQHVYKVQTHNTYTALEYISGGQVYFTVFEEDDAEREEQVCTLRVPSRGNFLVKLWDDGCAIQNRNNVALYSYEQDGGLKHKWSTSEFHAQVRLGSFAVTAKGDVILLDYASDRNYCKAIIYVKNDASATTHVQKINLANGKVLTNADGSCIVISNKGSIKILSRRADLDFVQERQVRALVSLFSWDPNTIDYQGNYVHLQSSEHKEVQYFKVDDQVLPKPLKFDSTIAAAQFDDGSEHVMVVYKDGRTEEISLLDIDPSTSQQ